MDTKEDFSEALARCRQLSEAEATLLALAFEHTNGVTAPQVAEVLGYKHFVAANALAGRLGRKISEHLSYSKADGKTIEWWTIIFTGKHNSTRGFVWYLKPGLKAALTTSLPL
ncbi:hypothetical protein J0X19_16995 [Hymenobacter sp. BT186]|uniref:Uncharacterized protein n=1 Tax=Hymenobacter telluris TaxID=2816474 RepID=A0A939F009_9BACT|nr:hypothetical protein [Hymenobacter telluris]MBO0359660.1 hypothetical protein [Hymenobacter telluris]MBW3375687.1 hypothetical protein [Hymenobacter norwichensis]